MRRNHRELADVQDLLEYCQPASFSITTAIKPNDENSIALSCTREFVNELGTGGMVAPVLIYVEK